MGAWTDAYRIPGLLRAMILLTRPTIRFPALVGIMYRGNRIVSTLNWYVGRLNLLAGIVTLGAASAMLAVSSRRRTHSQDSEVSLRLMPLILAGFTLLFFASGRQPRAEKNQSVKIERVRTGKGQ